MSYSANMLNANQVNEAGVPLGEGSGSSLINFWKILHVLQKWWWLIALIVTFFVALTVLVLFRITPIYKASTTLEVKQEERTILDISQVENVIADKEFLTTQVELLKGRQLIEDVILDLNLLNDTSFIDPDDEGWSVLSRDQKLSLIARGFQSRLTVQPVGRTRLINVSFEHPDPKKAALITNSLTETFINNSLSNKFNTTAYAREFLEDRLVLIKGELEQAERKLVKYASDNGIIIIREDVNDEASGGLETTALVTLNAELTQARLDRTSAELTYLQAREAGFGSDILNNLALNGLKEERIKLTSEYREKLAIFKPEFPDMLELKNRIELFDKEIQSQESAIISAKLSESSAQFEIAKARENDLAARVNRLKSSVFDGRESRVDYNILKREVETSRTQYEGLLQRLKEVSVVDEIGSTLVQIIDPARAPLNPFKPNKLRSLILAFLLSGVLGFGLCYLIEIIDDRVKTPDDVKQNLNQTIMGVIPIDPVQSEIVEHLEDPQTVLSEAYASVRTNINFSGPDGGPKVIQVTSTRSGEGKSVTSLALALRFAGVGHSVLLVDADMRLPTFLEKDSDSIGLSGLLTSNADIKRNIHQTRFENLQLIPAGRKVPNPSEILSSPRFEQILSFVRETHDYVIIDSPPVLGLADSPIIGATVDATLVVVEAGKLRTQTVRTTFERLVNSGTKILGVILSKYNVPSKGYMNYYQYSYGSNFGNYGPESKKKKTKAAAAKRKMEII